SIVVITAVRGRAELRDECGSHVGGYRGNTIAARGQHRESESVISRQHGEIMRTMTEYLGDLREIPGRLLNRDDVGMVRKLESGLGGDIARGPARHVVDDDWEVDRIRDRPKVRHYSPLGRLVVGGRNVQQVCRAGVAHHA